MSRAIQQLALLVTLISFIPCGLAQELPPKSPPRTTPITVTGTALDETGQPVKGATIFLVSTNGSPAKLLAQTLSGDNGQYEFRDIPLPEARPEKPTDRYQAGCFQVFGKAPGRAFAWHGMKFYYADPKYAAESPQTVAFYRKHGFLAGDDIELDLTFPPPQRVSGRLLDENGQPVVGAKIHLGRCDYVDTTGKDDHVNFREFWAAYQAADVMPDHFITTTDQDGRFALSAVPPGVVFYLGISHADYAHVTLYAATAESFPETYQNQPLVKLPIELTMSAVRTILFRVVLGDTGDSAPQVGVAASQHDASGVTAYGVSDQDGRLTLKLPSGRYKLEGSPPKELDYILTTQDLVVESSPAEQPFTLKIQPGCVLILRAIDADTDGGLGIPGVSFAEEMTELPGGRPGRGMTSVQSHTTRVDHPKTNADGEIRAVVVPGSRHYGVGFNPLPEGYRPIKSQDSRPGRLLKLPAGETVVAEFLLKKSK